MRQKVIFIVRLNVPVSIHAPARDATFVVVWHQFARFVSIHAPARDATCENPRYGYLYRVSIHAPARDATEGIQEGSQRFGVSIHAPARDATSQRETVLVNVMGFNPRTREGCDLIGFGFEPSADWFQSTHPRGMRQWGISSLI